MNTIGQIIKERRKEFGIPQKQLAQIAEVNVNTLTQIEKGEGNPTVRTVERLLEVLGLELTVKTIEL